MYNVYMDSSLRPNMRIAFYANSREAMPRTVNRVNSKSKEEEEIVINYYRIIVVRVTCTLFRFVF